MAVSTGSLYTYSFGDDIDGANVSILSVVDGMSSYILLAVLLSDANRMNLLCSILLRIKLVQHGPKILSMRLVDTSTTPRPLQLADIVNMILVISSLIH
jgi:hypothetical protein